MSEKKINLKSNMTVTELEPPLPSASKLIWIVCVGPFGFTCMGLVF